MFCDYCGERYREVWKAGRLRPLLYSDNSLHACQGSRKELAEKMKHNHGGNWGRKRKGKASIYRAKGGSGRKRFQKNRSAPNWTASDAANREADARLRHVLEAA